VAISVAQRSFAFDTLFKNDAFFRFEIRQIFNRTSVDIVQN